METNQIAIYQPDRSMKLEVRMEEETVWLTQAQMGMLFQRNRSVITKHILNIFKERELDKNSVCANFAHTATDGKIYEVEHYNLDMIISVGYRVKSRQGILFRQWATSVLKDYLIKGYAINQRFERLEDRTLENEKQIAFFVKAALPPVEGIFYDGQVFDAYAFVSDLSEPRFSQDFRDYQDFSCDKFNLDNRVNLVKIVVQTGFATTQCTIPACGSAHFRPLTRPVSPYR